MLSALAACGFQVNASGPIGDDQPMIDAPPPVDAWLPGFGQRKPIDLTGQPTELVEFVASIAVQSDADLVGAAAIAFTAADGTTPLPAEVVVFDPATGTLDAWVRTTLAASATTRIYLYYGDGPPPITALPWTDRHAGVWHMTAAGTNNDTAKDSKLLHDATASLTQIPQVVDGVVGVGRDYDGLNDSMSIPDPADGSLDFGTRSFTIDLWVNVTQSQGPFDMPIFKGGSSNGTEGWDYELGTTSWNAGFSDGTSIIVVPFGPESAMLGGWRHLVAVVDRSTNQIKTYVDGAVATTVGFVRDSFDSPYPLDFGNSTYEFRGKLDEVRLYNEALTPDWIAAEHANLAKRPSFVTMLPRETRP